MATARIPKSYRLSQNTLDYIDAMSKEWNLDKTDTIEKIVDDHKHMQEERKGYDEIADIFVKKVEEQNKKLIKEFSNKENNRRKT